MGKEQVLMFDKRRKIATSLTGHVLPVVVQQLNALSKGLGHLKVLR